MEMPASETRYSQPYAHGEFVCSLFGQATSVNSPAEASAKGSGLFQSGQAWRKEAE